MSCSYVAELTAKRTTAQTQTNHFSGFGVPISASQTGTVTPSHNEGSDPSHATRNILRAETRAKTENLTEVLSKRALRETDQWCDLWLNGDLTGVDDWDTFKDCLDLPDGLEKSVVHSSPLR